MSDPLTTEQMREALEAAGKRVKKNATDDEIGMAHLELEAELEAAGAVGADGDPGPAEVTPPVPDPVNPPEPPVSSEVSSASKGETIDDVLTRVRSAVMRENKRDYMGDKEPEVIAWARQNLTPDEFEARYAGRI